ncbi:type III-B CRISPR module-associated protein Cmr3 [Melaminivora suipulveris]|uniref:Type III-B CRISPR module-associated protein Cmr3 n=1 Tax=Melaminivora suipulveris TaxID=2109913 RepID=A0A2R3QBW4_9BURK|nr:type III-B CRISPR module-associated Cmr3 family protein [Melaminivora suipulveris]AVO49249.1 type III-B CRISPR module-associated protein Cmr3 [Melaminivora suipulveris]
MTTTPHSRFIEPLDMLVLRGNQLFGEPGSYGEALMPPWPSVAAGALRTRILADAGIDLAAFASGQVAHPQLGTPAAPGSFVLQAFQVARRAADGTAEPLMPLPADLVVQAPGDAPPQVSSLRPSALHAGVCSSNPLPQAPVLPQGDERSKPASGWWLRGSGWHKYLRGQGLTATDLIRSRELWSFDERVGVGLDGGTRSAADGQLFTVRAVAMQQGVGFAAAVAGADLPAGGSLRLGGDGRAAALHHVPVAWSEPDHEAISAAGRCRIVLTSPGIFAGGWMLPGMDASLRIQLPGLSARVVAAAVSRADTVSGWDLAARRPKAAQKTAAAGSVYWLDELQATPDALRKLAARGLWNEPCEDAQRRAEGFNRFSFASY